MLWLAVLIIFAVLAAGILVGVAGWYTIPIVAAFAWVAFSVRRR